MRNLRPAELSQITGGLTCIDPDTYKKMHNKAIQDAIILAGISGALVGAIGWGAVNPLVGTLSGVVAAHYAAAYGYFYSSTWNLIYN